MTLLQDLTNDWVHFENTVYGIWLAAIIITMDRQAGSMCVYVKVYQSKMLLFLQLLVTLTSMIGSCPLTPTVRCCFFITTVSCFAFNPAPTGTVTDTSLSV